MSQWKRAGWVWAVWLVLCGLCVDIAYGQQTFHWTATSGGSFTLNTNWISGTKNPGVQFSSWKPYFFEMLGQTGNVTFPGGFTVIAISGLEISPLSGQAPLLLLTSPVSASASLEISSAGDVYPLIITEGDGAFYGSLAFTGTGDPCLGSLAGTCINVQANVQTTLPFILDCAANLTAPNPNNIYYNGQLDIGAGDATFNAIGDIYFDPSSTVNFFDTGRLYFHINSAVPNHPSDVGFTVGTMNVHSAKGQIFLENAPSSPTAVLQLAGATTIYSGANLTISVGTQSFGPVGASNMGTITVQANAGLSVGIPQFTTTATSAINLAAGGVLTLMGTQDAGDVFSVGGISGGIVIIQTVVTITGAQSTAFSISGPSAATFNGATTGCTFSCDANCNTNFAGTATHTGSVFTLSGSGVWNIQAPMSGAHFNFNGGTLTFAGTCTGCTFSGQPTSLTIGGSLPQSNITLSGGSATISATGVQAITLSGGTHTISGGGASNPITISGTAQVNFQNAQSTSGQITVQGGTVSTSGTSTFTKAVVTVSGGTFTASGLISSASNWTISGSTLTTSSSYFSQDSLAITGTLSATDGNFTGVYVTCTSNANCGFGTSTVTSSTLTLNNNAVVSGSSVGLSALFWYGGNLGVTGTAQAATFAPSASAFITGQLTTTGTITWTSGDIMLGSSTAAGTLVVGSGVTLSSTTGHVTGATVALGELNVQGTVNVAGITANIVRLQGGTIDLAGRPIQTTSIIFSGGTISNTPISASSTGQVAAGSNSTTLQNSSFTGNYLIQNGPLNLVSTTLVNAPTGTMTLNGPITSTSDSAIINNGTLTHSSANGTVLSISIQNRGTFQNSGNLTVNGLFSCIGGSIQTAAASTFAFSGPPLTLTTACSLKGAGVFSFNSETSLLANLAAANVEVAGNITFSTQNIQSLKFTSGSITGTSLNVSSLVWTSGTLSAPTTTQTLVLGGNMQLEGDIITASLADTGASNEVLSSSSGHKLTTTSTQISGKLVLNNINLVNAGTINVALNGSVTVNGVFSCGVAAQQLNVLGYFAVKSPSVTSLACTTSGTGTFATYSQLSIATTFGISNLLIANTSFTVNQAVNLAGLILNSSSIVGTNTLTVGSLSVGPGQSTMNNVAFTLSTAGTFDGSLTLNNVTLTCHAAITLNANGAFIIGGNFTLPTNCLISGPGVLGSTGSLTVPYRITVGGLSATGGSLNLTAGGNYTFGSFALNNSHLIGNIDTVTVTNTAAFTSTTFGNKLVLSGASTTFSGTNVFGFVNNSGSLTISDGQHTVATFLNSGDVILAAPSAGQKRATSPGTLVPGQFNMTAGTVVFNGGEIQVTNSSLFTVNNGEMSGTGTFINSGSVILYSAQQMDNVEFDNYGTLKVMNYTTSIGGGGTLAGTIQVARDAELNLSGGVFVLTNTGSISGDGSFANSASLTLNGNFSLKTVTIENGSIDFAANVFSGAISWTGGAINTLNLASSSQVNVTTNTTKSLTNALTNNGAMSFNGPVTFSAQATLINNGAITLGDNTTLGVTDNLLGNVAGNLTNYGSLEIPYNASGVNIQTTLFNYGTFLIASSTLLPSSTHINANASTVLIGSPVVTSSIFRLTNNATLSGSGAITGTVVNSGLMYVGNITGTTPGSMTFNNLNQSATGILFMDIFEFSSYDKITVQGELSLVDKVSVIVIDARVDITSYADTNGLQLMTTGLRDGVWNEVYPDNTFGGLKYTSSTISFVIKSLSSTTQTSGNGDRTAVSPGLSGPKIAGIVIGVVVGILIISAIAVFIILRRKDKEVAIKMESLEPEAAPTEQDALEYSFDFYTYQVSHKEHSRMNHLLQLHDMLVEDNMLLVDTLVAVTDAKDGESINYVARSLTYLLETKRMFLTWFERMLQDEVNNCLSKETLFRGNNMFTKSMTAYAIMVGTRYLQTTLFEPMQKLSSIADIQSPELDPNRMTDQSDLAISKDVLQLLSRLIFASLQKSIPSVPIQLSMVCNLIKTNVIRKYPDSEALALGGFFFLRFLNPVIVSPDRFGITKASPDANVRRAELLVSKVMMAIVNGVLFGEKEAYMIILNDFVEQQREPLYKLLADLTKVDTRASSVEPIQVPNNVTQVSLCYIHKQIAANMDGKIKNFLNCVPPPPPKNYECPRDLMPFFEVHYPKEAAVPRTPQMESASLIASSSSSALPGQSDEHTKYTNVLRKLANVTPEERAARQRLYEKLKAFLAQAGSAPLNIQGDKEPGKKVQLV